MSKTKDAWEASSWDELKQLTSLEVVKRALRARELQRQYHKTQYLKRQAILAEAKKRGITG